VLKVLYSDEAGTMAMAVRAPRNKERALASILLLLFMFAAVLGVPRALDPRPRTPHPTPNTLKLVQFAVCAVPCMLHHVLGTLHPVKRTVYPVLSTTNNPI